MFLLNGAVAMAASVGGVALGVGAGLAAAAAYHGAAKVRKRVSR